MRALFAADFKQEEARFAVVAPTNRGMDVAGSGGGTGPGNGNQAIAPRRS
jgi:hypothetical protein